MPDNRKPNTPADNSPQLYLDLDAQNYDVTLNRLVAEVKNQNADFPAASEPALRNYFSVALVRGTDFSLIRFDQLAHMSAEQIDAQAQQLPDKLSPESRERFAEAGESRSETARWNALFPDGRDEFVLPLAPDARSMQERIADYLVKWNEQAAQAVADAQANGTPIKHDDIKFRQLRINPNDPTRLQTFNAGKDVWEPNSFEGRVANVSSYITSTQSRGLTDEQKAEFVTAFNSVTGGNLTPETLTAANVKTILAQQFPDKSVKELERVLGEVSARVSDTNPFHTYKEQKPNQSFDGRIANISSYVTAPTGKALTNEQKVEIITALNDVTGSDLTPDPKSFTTANVKAILNRQVPDQSVAGLEQVLGEVSARVSDTNPFRTYKGKESGQNLGAFLQAQQQWALYEDFQLEQSRKGGGTEDTRRPIDPLEVLARDSRLDVGQRSHPSADNYDPDSIRIVVSRDPQKIGEMSSGQHWESCMGEVWGGRPGVNFHYVPKDIEAGTLVAYVVAQDDVQARHPLMRMLLKPYVNEETGETVLIPAKIYGGETAGNSRTRQALTDTMNDFVREHVNAGKSGTFVMDKRLYGDNQPGVATINVEWNQESVQTLMNKAYGSALQEYATELHQRELVIAYPSNYTDEEVQTATWQAKDYRKKIDHLAKPEEFARDVYREMRKTSADEYLPQPQMMIDALNASGNVERNNALLQAYKSKDTKPLEEYLSTRPVSEQVETASNAIKLFPGDNNTTGAFVKLWAGYVNNLDTPKERIDAALEQLPRYGGLGADLMDPHQEASRQIVLDNLNQLEPPQERLAIARRVFDGMGSGYSIRDAHQQRDQAAALIMDNLASEPDAQKRVEHATAVLEIIKRIPPELTLRAADAINEDLDKLSYGENRVRAAEKLLSAGKEYLDQDYDKLQQFAPEAMAHAKDVLRRDIGGVRNENHRNSLIRNLDGEIDGVNKYALESQTSEIQNKRNAAVNEDTPGNVKNWRDAVDTLPTAQWRVGSALDAYQYLRNMPSFAEGKSPLSAGIASTLMQEAPNLASAEEQANAYHAAARIYGNTPEGENATRKLLAVVGDESNHLAPQQRIEYLDQIMTFGPGHPLTGQAAGVIATQAGKLNTAEERITASAVAALSAQPGSDTEKLLIDNISRHMAELPDDAARKAMAANIMMQIDEMRNQEGLHLEGKQGAALKNYLAAVKEGTAQYPQPSEIQPPEAKLPVAAANPEPNSVLALRIVRQARTINDSGANSTVIHVEDVLGGGKFSGGNRADIWDHSRGVFDKEKLATATREELIALQSELDNPELLKAKMDYASAHLQMEKAGGLTPDVVAAVNAADARAQSTSDPVAVLNRSAERTQSRIPEIQANLRRAGEDTDRPWTTFVEHSGGALGEAYKPALPEESGKSFYVEVPPPRPHAPADTVTAIAEATQSEIFLFQSVRGRPPSMVEERQMQDALQAGLNRELEGKTGQDRATAIELFRSEGYARGVESDLVDKMRDAAGTSFDGPAAMRMLDDHVAALRGSGQNIHQILDNLTQGDTAAAQNLNRQMAAQSGEIEQTMRAQLREIAQSQGLSPEAAEGIRISVEPARPAGTVIDPGRIAEGISWGYDMHMSVPATGNPADAASILNAYAAEARARAGSGANGQSVRPEDNGIVLHGTTATNFLSLIEQPALGAGDRAAARRLGLPGAISATDSDAGRDAVSRSDISTVTEAANTPDARTGEVSSVSPIRDEATRWSDLPRVIQNYTELSDREGGGVGRLFGYASLIKDHANEKPTGSTGLPNENATLPGMEVAMNVLAVGREYRGASGTYTDANGQERYFANSGLYAGLEPATSPGGFASGMNITTTPEDRNESLKAYIKRELGKPPEGITLDDLFDPNAASKFEALKGTPQDEFGMYKFQIVNAEIKAGDAGVKQAPAITVSTNENSRFSAIGLTPMQAADRILDGQGYRRTEGNSIKGGPALDYFQNAALGTARELNLEQPRLNATNEAIGRLTNIYGQMADIQSVNLPPGEEYKREALMYASSYAHRKDLTGLYSPLFGKDESTNARDPLTPADLALPGNETMAHTAEEKFARIAGLRDSAAGASQGTPALSSGAPPVVAPSQVSGPASGDPIHTQTLRPPAPTDPWRIPSYEALPNPAESIYQHSQRSLDELSADAAAKGRATIRRADVPLTPERQLYHEAIVDLATTTRFDSPEQLRAAVDQLVQSPEYRSALDGVSQETVASRAAEVTRNFTQQHGLEQLQTFPPSERTVDIITGGPGSGKSTLRDAHVMGLQEEGKPAGVVIDTDGYYALFGDSASLGRRLPNMTHQEASLLSEEINGRLNTMVAETGRAPNVVMDKPVIQTSQIKDISKNAGTVEIFTTFCPVEQSVERAGKRADLTNREVPTESLLELSRDVARNTTSLMRKPKVNLTIYDTDVPYGEAPKVLMEKDGARNEIIVHDPAKLAALLNQDQININAHSPGEVYEGANLVGVVGRLQETAVALKNTRIILNDPATQQPMAEIEGSKVTIKNETLLKATLNETDFNQLRQSAEKSGTLSPSTGEQNGQDNQTGALEKSTRENAAAGRGAGDASGRPGSGDGISPDGAGLPAGGDRGRSVDGYVATADATGQAKPTSLGETVHIGPLVPMNTEQAASFLKYSAARSEDNLYRNPGSDGRFTGAVITQDGNLVTANSRNASAEAIVFDSATGKATSFPVANELSPANGSRNPDIHSFDLSQYRQNGQQVYVLVGGEGGSHADALAAALKANPNATPQELSKTVGGENSALLRATPGNTTVAAVFEPATGAAPARDFGQLAETTTHLDVRDAGAQSATLSSRNGSTRSILPASPAQSTPRQLGEALPPPLAPEPDAASHAGSGGLLLTPNILSRIASGERPAPSHPDTDKERIPMDFGMFRTPPEVRLPDPAKLTELHTALQEATQNGAQVREGTGSRKVLMGSEESMKGLKAKFEAAGITAKVLSVGAGRAMIVSEDGNIAQMNDVLGKVQPQPGGASRPAGSEPSTPPGGPDVVASQPSQQGEEQTRSVTPQPITGQLLLKPEEAPAPRPFLVQPDNGEVSSPGLAVIPLADPAAANTVLRPGQTADLLQFPNPAANGSVSAGGDSPTTGQTNNLVEMPRTVATDNTQGPVRTGDLLQMPNPTAAGSTTIPAQPGNVVEMPSTAPQGQPAVVAVDTPGPLPQNGAPKQPALNVPAYDENKHVEQTSATEQITGGLASSYTVWMQGKTAVEDWQKGNYLGSGLNGLSSVTGATEVVGGALAKTAQAKNAIGKVGKVGNVLGYAVDGYNVYEAYSQGKSTQEGKDLALNVGTHAVVNRAVIAAGGLGATSLVTAFDTANTNYQSMSAAQKAMSQVNVDTEHFQHLGAMMQELQTTNDPQTGKPLLSGLVMQTVPKMEDGKPVMKDGKPVMTQVPDLTNTENQQKIRAALDRESIVLYDAAESNDGKFVYPVPVIGNVRMPAFDGITSAKVSTGIAFNDPESVRRMSAIEAMRKQVDVANAELSNVSSAINYTTGTQERTAAQRQDDVITAKRAGVPTQNYPYTYERSYYHADKYIAASDKNEPIPPEMMAAFKADPENGRIYEQPLYKKDDHGRIVNDAHGKPIVEGIKRWEIIDPDQARRPSSLGMTTSEQQQAFGSTWRAERQADVNEAHKAFDQAASDYAKNPADATHLVDAYQKYRDSLKVMKETADALGLSKEDVKNINMSMAQASVEFNQAFDDQIKAMKEANAQPQPERHYAPAAPDRPQQQQPVR